MPKALPARDEGPFLAAHGVTPAAVVADLFGPTQEQMNGFAAGPWALVVVDDGSPIEFDADLLLSPSLDDRRTHRCSARTVYVRGRQAIILRGQFRDVPMHAMHQSPNEVLVCMGGSDPVGATTRVVEALLSASLPGVERITVALGRDYGGARVPHDERLLVIRDVRDMCDLMRSADIGVLSAGNLLYESMAVGLPSILVALTPEQSREAAFAHERGAAVRLGAPNDVTSMALSQVFDRLSDVGVRRQLSARARELVNPQTGDHLAQRVARVCTRGRSR
jgi:spore coat polysaccharide biosynthesis predicted glycosyltransferase SpsG